MGTTKGFELSQFTLLHIDFVVSMQNSGAFTKKQALEEITQHVSNSTPPEAQKILLPMSEEAYRMIHEHFQGGRRKIAIYKDGEGQRYIVADSYTPKKI